MQPRESGSALSSMSKPSLLARANRGRSAPSPSLKSIIAWTGKLRVNQRDSSIRGTKCRCLPRIEPPNFPVTNKNLQRARRCAKPSDLSLLLRRQKPKLQRDHAWHWFRRQRSAHRIFSPRLEDRRKVFLPRRLFSAMAQSASESEPGQARHRGEIT